MHSPFSKLAKSQTRTSNRKQSRLAFETLEERLALTVQPLAEFAAVAPFGSQVFSSSNTATIDTVDEVETFEASLDAGQTLSATLSSASLSGSISVLAPDGSELANATAASPGDSLFISSVPITSEGVYSIVVTGQSVSAGSFDLEAILNAQLEEEQFGGLDNGTPAVAEDLLFRPIGPFSKGEQASVTGSTVVVGGSQETYSTSLARTSGVFSPNILDFDFSTPLPAIGDVTLTLNAMADLGGADEFLTVEAEGLFSENVFVTGGGERIPVSASITISAETFNAIAADGLSEFTVTPSDGVDGLGTTSLTVTLSYVTSETPATSAEDWYRFALNDGQTVTLALAGSADKLDLFSADGSTLIAEGVSAGEAGQVITGFVDNSTDGSSKNYLVRVSGAAGEYTLLATRDATYDMALSKDSSGASRLGTYTRVIGSITPELGGTELSLPADFLGSPLSIGFAADGSFISAGRGIERNGVEFVKFGTELASYSVGFNGLTSTNKLPISRGSFFPVTATDVSTATINAILVSGEVRPGVIFSRLVQWQKDQEVIHVTITIENQSGADLSNVAFLENIDPDNGGSFNTTNTVLPGADLAVASNTAGSIGIGSTDPAAVLSTVGFEIDNPFTVINSPSAPGSNSGDTAISLAFDWGDLAVGQSVSSSFLILLADNQAAAASLFDSVGDIPTLNGSGGGDLYTFRAQAGDSLAIETFTPASGAGAFANPIDIGVELTDPNGDVLSHVNTPGDELLATVAAITGDYTVRLFSENGEAGEFALEVRGATDLATPFEVTSASVADGEQFLPDSLTELTLDFGGQLRLDTVSADDLLVNGLPATGVTVVGPSSLRFDLPALNDGTNTLSLPAGSLTDLTGRTVEAFEVSILVDGDGPRVIAASILDGDVLPPGVSDFSITFDESIDTARLGVEDLQLVGNRTGVQPLTDIAFDTTTNEFTFSSPDLPEDTYTLYLRSGPAAFADLLGSPLDGEPSAIGTVPSGDGTPGGDFFLTFEVDTDDAPLSNFTRLDPTGSLAYRATASALLGSATDVDSFIVALDPNQTLTLVVESEGRPSVSVLSPDGTTVVDATAPAIGEAVVVQKLPILAAGDYVIQLSDADGLPGEIRLEANLNAQVEAEEFGEPNNSLPSDAETLLFSNPVDTAGPAIATVTGSISETGPIFTSSQSATGVFSPNVVTLDLDALPTPVGDAVLTIDANTDLNATSEFLSLRAEGISFGNIFVNDGLQNQPVSTTIAIPLATLETLAVDGVVSFVVTPSPSVGNFGASTVTLTLEYPVESAEGDDWYKLPLADGQLATVALAGSSAEVELYASDGSTLLAAGRSTSELTSVIENYADVTADDSEENYLIRVVAGTGEYQLTVTRDAAFDIEGNDSFDEAQDLSNTSGAFGFVASPSSSDPTGDADWYNVSLNAGDTVTLGITTPAAGPGEFVNPLGAGIPGGLIISEVVDGSVAGGNPNFIEITNTTTTPFTFAEGGLIVQTNANTDRSIDVDLSGITIESGQSFVIASSSSGGTATFESVFGFAADLYADEITGDGNDRYALTDTNDGSSILDSYGELDINGTGQPWEYTEGYAIRQSSSIFPAGELFKAGDWFISEVNALNNGVDTPTTLLQTLTTPGTHNFIPGDAPLARIAVYLPDGTLQEPEADAISFTAEQTGFYRVLVSAVAEAGEYILTVDGATGDDAAPTITAITPADGTLTRSLPSRVDVTFSEQLAPGVVEAEDLLINGLSVATEVTAIDAFTYSFVIDRAAVDSGDGVYDLTVPAAAVTDLQGNVNEVFSSTLTVDSAGPRIIEALVNGLALPPGVTFLPGDTSLSFVFDEEINPATLSEANFQLTEVISGTFVALDTFNYDPTTRTLDVDYTAIGEGIYEFFLGSSRGAGIQDFAGNRLDGESVGPGLGGLPSGDGLPGGNFTFGFQVDSVGPGTIGPYSRLEPLGGLIFASENNPGLLNQAGDVDDYDLNVSAGEVISAVVTPTDPSSILSVAIVGLAGLYTAPGPGEAVVIPAVTSPVDATLTLRVVGDVPTPYLIDVFLNTSLEQSVQDTGLGAPLSIDASALNSPAGRLAVVGNVEPVASTTLVYAEDFNSGLAGFSINNSAGSGSGLWSLSNGRQLDGEPNHTAPNSLYFGQNETPFAGGDYSTGGAVGGVVTSPTIALPADAMLTFSHLIETDRAADLAQVSVLVGSSATPILSTADGGLTVDSNGTWVTATADLSDFADRNIRLQFSFDTNDSIDNNHEGWFVDDIRIVGAGASIADADEYTFTATAGVPLDIVLAGQGGADFTDAFFQVFDPLTNEILATGTPDPFGDTATNYDQGVLDFVPMFDGELGVRIVSEDAGRYAVVVTQDLLFEGEPNSDANSSGVRLLSTGNTALGYLTSDFGTGSSRLFATDDARADLVELDPATGEIINRVPLPAGGSGAVGLAYDGNSIFYVNNGSLFFELDPDTGAVLDSDSLSSFGVSSSIDALAVVGGTVAVLDHVSDRLFYLDTESDTLLGSVSLQAAVVGGAAGAGSRGSVFISDFGADVIREFDPSTGSQLGFVPAPAGSTYGLAFFDGRLYASDASTRTVYELDPDSGEILSTFNLGLSFSALAGDDPSGPAPFLAPGLSDSNSGTSDTLPAAAYTAFRPIGVDIEDIATQILHAADGDDTDDHTSHPYEQSPRFGEHVDATKLIVEDEAEPNDSIATADDLPLGFDLGEDTAIDVSGNLSGGDTDYFRVNLRAGDILGASVVGARLISLFDASGTLLIGSDQDLTSIHPISSPLPSGGAALSRVIDTDGEYFISVANATGLGSYNMSLRLFRPALEAEPAGIRQVLFLDFDGETIDTSIFGRFGTAALSPLTNYLGRWGLSAGDEDAVIDAIVQSVEESLADDVRMFGLNGDFSNGGPLGSFDIEILNSRDHVDPFGTDHVSRVIIGGSISELGISTIGIAESIDVGNFDTSESAVVLLDLLSASSRDPNSLNRINRDASTSIIDLIGVGVGNIVAHEAGHFFGNWHTNNSNASANIADQGGSIANTIGLVGSVWGDGDERDVDFGPDTFAANEGFTGLQNTLNTIAFGLATGTVNPLLVGPRVEAITPRAGTTNDLNITSVSVQFSETLSIASAASSSNYQLIEAGLNGIFEGGAGDDRVVTVVPTYDGAQNVELAIQEGPLRPGSYQLTLNGESSIEDLDGNPLNAVDGPGTGSNTTHEFEVVLQLPLGGDFYQLELAAGSGVTVETGFPLLSSSGPANTLDAQLTIFDPLGNIVGLDQDSADGVNASLTFYAALEGTYIVQVTAEDEGSGEYLLTTREASFALVGDSNEDGVVDTADYTLIRNWEGKSVAPFTNGDNNGDGAVDESDWRRWRSNYGVTLATATVEDFIHVPSPVEASSPVASSELVSAPSRFTASVVVETSLPVVEQNTQAEQIRNSAAAFAVFSDTQGSRTASEPVEGSIASSSLRDDLFLLIAADSLSDNDGLQADRYDFQAFDLEEEEQDDSEETLEIAFSSFS